MLYQRLSKTIVAFQCEIDIHSFIHVVVGSPHIHIRYDWELTRLWENCVCGVKFGLQHALSCKKGGFVTIRHNQVRNITTTLLNEICNDVQFEPQLQSLSGEHFDAKTPNKHEDARLDILMRGFWCSGQKALFDIRVSKPIASRYRNTPLSECYT